MPNEDCLSSSLLVDLKAGRGTAIEKIWQRYFTQIVQVARHRLGDFPRRVEDEEDVAVSVFRRICEMADHDQLNQLRNGEDLWALLTVITAGKVLDLIDRQTAAKRGGGAVRGESALRKTKSESGKDGGLNLIPDESLSPEAKAAVEEEVERLFNLLPDAETRQIAELLMQGQSKKSIADEMQISRTGVYVKIGRIWSAWRSEAINV